LDRAQLSGDAATQGTCNPLTIRVRRRSWPRLSGIERSVGAESELSTDGVILRRNPRLPRLALARKREMAFVDTLLQAWIQSRR
jgi:hypothetical protein